MNDQPDIDRILHIWLSDGPIEMPDRVVAVAHANRDSGRIRDAAVG